MNNAMVCGSLLVLGLPALTLAAGGGSKAPKGTPGIAGFNGRDSTQTTPSTVGQDGGQGGAGGDAGPGTAFTIAGDGGRGGHGGTGGNGGLIQPAYYSTGNPDDSFSGSRGGNGGLGGNGGNLPGGPKGKNGSGGDGGDGGAGLNLNDTSNVIINLTGGLHKGGDGGSGAAPLVLGDVGGRGGAGGDGLTYSGTRTSIAGGTYFGGLGGDSGDNSGYFAPGGNAVSVATNSSLAINGGIFSVAVPSAGSVAGFDFFSTGLSTITISGIFSNINPSGGTFSGGVLTGSGSFDGLLSNNKSVQSFTYDAVNGARIILAPDNAPVPEASSAVAFGALLALGGVVVAFRRRNNLSVTS